MGFQKYISSSRYSVFSILARFFYWRFFDKGILLEEKMNVSIVIF